ncbi:MAG TPA: PAS domain S-box protein, partial [bacterium]|nr:PAS domain S-box protein [bacterium]
MATPSQTPKPLRLLMVDDDREDFESVRHLLAGLKEPGYVLEWAPDYEAGLARVREGGLDLILVDYLLGPRSGLDFLRDASLLPDGPPLLVLAGQGSPELNREAIARGAADYLLKGGLTADQLHRSIRYALERAKVMRELRQRGEWFRALIENALDGVSIVEKDGTTSYLSPAIEPMLGYTPQERAGRNSFELIHPEDAPRVAQALADLFEGPGRQQRVEFRFKHKDGSWRFLEASAMSHDFQSPSLRGVVVHYRDISDRKSAEEVLRRSEGNLRAIFNNSSQFICLMDKDANLVAFNEKASLNSVFLGGKPFEPGRNLMDYVPAPHHDMVRGRLGEALAGRSLRLESQFTDPTGETHWYEVAYNPVQDEKGEVTGVCLMGSTIDERKRAEKALRESEERFRRVFENSPVGICLVGMDSKIQVANTRFCAIVGYPARELEGKSFIDITYPPDIASDVQQYQQLVSGRIDSYEMEKRYIRKDRALVWANLTVTLVRDEAGRPLCGLGMAEDVTERKKNEGALSELAA